MKTENHIQHILQLYEFGMNIGRTLNYKKSCNLFLKLLLKRKNLNAAYVLEHDHQFIKSTYSIPLEKDINVPLTNEIKNKLQAISSSILINNTKELFTLINIPIRKGTIAVFNIQNNSYLVLFTNNNNLTEKELSRLKPIIDKFAVSLEACRTFENQEKLLSNLKRQNQELNDYTQLVSHDLISPIQSIEALTSWVIEDLKDVLNNDATENLTLIKKNVEKMDTLVKGILEYSKIDKIENEKYNVNINSLVTEIKNNIKYKDNITFIIPNKLPIVKGDNYRLKQLFLHLIYNAINFNDKNKIIIELGFTEDANYWNFYIKDNGNGIEKKYHDKIFLVFQKLKDNYQASGIGLSIVKKIIETYKGQIYLESKLNVGSTFYFSIKK